MSDIRSRLRESLVPAVPAPFDADGHVAMKAQEAYAEWMAGQRIAGVAVWAHTGRGLRLAPDARRAVLASWRAAMPGRLVIAGVGGDDLAQMIMDAASTGADALMAFPPTALRSLPSGEQRKHIVDYYRRIESVGLPVIAFYLYEAAGGISFDDATLSEILSLPGVAGIKIATLDSIVTYQRVVRAARAVRPDTIIITGEDRFLGYSLMMGADAALIGMAAAATAVQADLLDAWYSHDHARFHSLASIVDAFAAEAFADPVEGYIQRLLWILASDGVIPAEAAHDPWVPPLPAGARERVDQALMRLMEAAG